MEHEKWNVKQQEERDLEGSVGTLDIKRGFDANDLGSNAKT